MKPRPGVTHTLRFVGIDERDFVGGGMDVLESDVGLWVMGSGRLDIRGEPARRMESEGNGSDLEVDRRDPDDAVRARRRHRRSRRTRASLATRRRRPNGRVFTQEAFNLTRSVRIEGTPSGPNAHLHQVLCTTVHPVRRDPLRRTAAGRATRRQSLRARPVRPAFPYVRRGLARVGRDRDGDPRLRFARVRPAHVERHRLHGLRRVRRERGRLLVGCPDQSNDVEYQHCMAAKLVPIPSYQGIHADWLQSRAWLGTRRERLCRGGESGEQRGERVRVV